ncbi:MnhB domain-containing protein [Halapricum hydrolyticum]|uniref:Cation:proton antiporter n=1 Tax=Halapricum hydrolyticum TaxID=2979991 RepID=A0AAE3LFN3_9EURY|nr:MnhB domain-containing protein [Halapricum hydrolyticum]MCU4718775.1 cation:proton antiporter [Halapricum hydrolyticum]MCU4727817.1 cation:proton antiporter [Halapricum hydrolyticum]
MKPYHESPVVTHTVRVVAPFILTFGLFTLLHGTKSVGGGFQGGVIVASVAVLFAFAFGVSQTEATLPGVRIVAFAALGLLSFAAVAGAALVVGRPFLDTTAFGVSPVYPVEVIEVAIGVTVASVVTGLFFELARADDA